MLTTIASRQDTVHCGLSPLGIPFRFAGTLLPALRAYSGYRGTDPARNEPPRSLGRLGALEVRLARSAAEIRRAQKLRFDVFYREKSAVAVAAYLARRDVDLFDAACDHLLVLDHSAAGAGKSPAVAGTCRLLRQDVAERAGGFYSAGEFDVGALLARRRDLRFLELERRSIRKPRWRSCRR
jgi:L-ornithine Nalpha-acyltransferase